MSDHTYHPGDRVERISTGERARFIASYIEDRGTISVKITDVQRHSNGYTRVEWPAPYTPPAPEWSCNTCQHKPVCVYVQSGDDGGFDNTCGGKHYAAKEGEIL